MAYAYKQSSSSGATGGSTSAQTTSLSGVGAGNLLLAMVSGYGGTTSLSVTVTDNKGNSYSKALDHYDAGYNQYVAVYSAANAAGGSVTLSVTPGVSAQLSVALLEFSGGAASSPLDGTGQGSGSSTAADSGAVAQAAAGNDLFAGLCTTAKVGNGLSESVAVSGTGWAKATGVNDGAGNNSAMPLSATYLASTDASAHHATWALSASDNWWALGASFKPAAAAASGYPPRGLLVHPAYGFQHPFFN